MEKKKMGRPTKDPKTKQIHLRLSESEMHVFEQCAAKTGMSMTDTIKYAVQKLNETHEKSSK